MATSRALRSAAAIAAVVALALALATIVAASSSSPPPPAPEPKQEWRVCEDSAVEKHVLVIDSARVSPWPVEIGKRWSVDIQLKHKGTSKDEVRDAEMTLKVYALKAVPVYSTTQDFCKASKKKHAFVNAIARAAGVDGDGEDGKKGDDGNSSGCPLKAGETTVLHVDGEWSAWAPASDKYRLRVTVKDRERPDSQSELLCVDVDVVARKPPSSSSAVAAS